MELTVARRGGDVPDAGDVDEAGLPIVTMPSLAKNAWLLWQRAYTEARKDQHPAVHDGVAGWEWTGTLMTLEQDLWRAMVPSSRNPALRPVANARNILRRYLRDSGNITIPGAMRGGGRHGTTWFIRDPYDDAVPPLWLDFTDEAAARRGDVAVTWRCPACQHEFPGQADLNEHRADAHPVTAPELPGDSLIRDVAACLGDDDRMHLSDVRELLAAGNPAVYGDWTVNRLAKTLREDHKLFTRQINIGTSIRTGITRDMLDEPLAKLNDIESQIIVAKAQASVPARDLAATARDAVSAILTEYETLKKQNAEQAAELESLRRQPVSQDLIDTALDKIVGPLKAENEDLKRRLAAARKVIGLG